MKLKEIIKEDIRNEIKATTTDSAAIKMIKRILKTTLLRYIWWLTNAPIPPKPQTTQNQPIRNKQSQ